MIVENDFWTTCYTHRNNMNDNLHDTFIWDGNKRGCSSCIHELKTQFSRELKRNYQHISVIRDKSGESSLLDKVAGECHDIILMAFHFSFDKSFLEYTSSPPNCINVVYFVISTNRIKVIMWGLCLILFWDTHKEISLMLKFVAYSTSVNFWRTVVVSAWSMRTNSVSG